MRRFLKWVVGLGLILILAGLGYGVTGYRAAQSDAEGLAARAVSLIESGQGGLGLGDNLSILLEVEDPAFLRHAGFDLTTPGVGVETLTQSLAPRGGVADWTPSLRALRRTGYAIGLERALTKPQILALYLDSVALGQGPDGISLTGLYSAAEAVFGASPDDLSDEEFARLVAAIGATGKVDLAEPSPDLTARVDRILRLVARQCSPQGRMDVGLDGCAE